ncbi:hypothetical protein [Mycobacterium sp.]|uniref:hypothetical protein n=1 Tax=Mycobacterium sp. TaxID=1785 RepID=UPI003F9EB91D
MNRSTNSWRPNFPIGLWARMQGGDEQVPQHALVTAVLGRGWLGDEAEVNPDNPARERISRNVAPDFAGNRSRLDASHERVSKFGSPQIGGFGGVVCSSEGLVFFDQ